MRKGYVFLLRRGFLGSLIGLTCGILLTLGILNYSGSKIKTYQDPSSINLTINFLLPMEQEDLTSKISITPEVPSARFSHQIKWINSSTMVLKIKQKGLPHGQLITIKIDRAPTKIPFIKKSFKTEFRPRVPLVLISKTELSDVSSRGPVPIIFNTPVDHEDITKFIKPPVPGKFKPLKAHFQENSYIDYSHWLYVPDNPLKNNTTYQILLSPGLRSKGGSQLRKGQKISFKTSRGLRVLRTYPINGSTNFPLYEKIKVTLDQDILKGSIEVTDLKTKKTLTGTVEIKDKDIVFRPAYAFLPGRSFRVKLNLTAKNNESLENYQFSFTTLKMERKFWLDVSLGKPHTVTVYKGDEKVRHMLASGGRPETPTPLGSFYTQDRGHSFWSSRFGEGATYWVRLVGQVLIHSVPRDNKWEIKKDEHKKLGLPASHGCIRLDEKDAKWVYENIPRGTLVIIHQ